MNENSELLSSEIENLRPPPFFFDYSLLEFLNLSRIPYEGPTAGFFIIQTTIEDPPSPVTDVEEGQLGSHVPDRIEPEP